MQLIQLPVEQFEIVIDDLLTKNKTATDKIRNYLLHNESPVVDTYGIPPIYLILILIIVATLTFLFLNSL
jgi:hypothetical protein